MQLPVASGAVKMFISTTQLNEYYRDEGLAALKGAREVLTQAGITCRDHIGVGQPAEVIVDYVREKGCRMVVMGTHGRGGFSGAVLGSIASRTVHMSPVPVLLVK